MTERFITSTLNKRDPAKETSLRPPKFADFPGQEKVKDQLELFVAAAKARGEALRGKICPVSIKLAQDEALFGEII